ncbi:hypothetical protein ACSBR2_041539 [Camellia fascicularis]
MIRWTDLADFLREHLELCCCATALFIVAAACTYLLPKPTMKPLQRVFILIAFSLVRTTFSSMVWTGTGGKLSVQEQGICWCHCYG